MKKALGSRVWRYNYLNQYTKRNFQSTLFNYFDYECCVIGAGPSGYAAAIKAGVDYGKKTCLIEKNNHVGGAALWNGALSSKTMWECSAEWDKIVDPTPRGYTIHSASVHLRDVQRRVKNAVRMKENQMTRQLKYFDIETYTGHGRFVDQNTLVVENEKGEVLHTITSDQFIIATGSRPREHPVYKADGQAIITSDHMMDMNEFPRSMVVVGAGVVGCEYATIFANFRQTQVYLISKYPNVLPFEDDDISRLVSESFGRKNICIQQGDLVDMKTVPRNDGSGLKRVEYTVKKHTGELHSQIVDCALFSIGRIPNLDNLGLEDIGVQFSKRGKLLTEKHQTSVKNIWAVGDITADISLVNTAEIEGRQAVRNIYGGESYDVVSNNLPYIFFVDPLVAAVGRNEKDCRNERIPHKVAYYDFNLVSRAIAKKRVGGMIKLIVTHHEDPKDIKILGIRATGPSASAIIDVITTAIGADISLHDLIVSTKIAYPSITESLQEVRRLLVPPLPPIDPPETNIKPETKINRKDYSVPKTGGTSIYKAECFPNWAYVRAWKPPISHDEPLEEDEE